MALMNESHHIHDESKDIHVDLAFPPLFSPFPLPPFFKFCVRLCTLVCMFVNNKDC